MLARFDEGIPDLAPGIGDAMGTGLGIQ